MPTTFDGVNLIITLPSHGGAGIINLDAQDDLYEPWKEWVQLSDNAKFPPAFRTIGGDPLTPGITAGAYFFVRNDFGWRIRAAEENSTVTLSGNIAPEDSTLPILIPTVGSFNVLIAGIQPVTQNVDLILTQQQDALYDGAVHIDTINGTAGTEFPIGTRSNAVDNLADALTIAANLGVSSFELLAGTITLTQDSSFTTWMASSGLAQIDINGQDVSGASFSGISLTGTIGTLTVPMVARNCFIEATTGICGNFIESYFKGTNVLATIADNPLTPGGRTLTSIFNCASDVAGQTAPIFDMNSLNIDLSVRGWIGGIEIHNCTNAANDISLDFVSGHAILDSSVTNGVFVLRGAGHKTDNSTGTTILETGFVNKTDVARETWLTQIPVV